MKNRKIIIVFIVMLAGVCLCQSFAYAANALRVPMKAWTAGEKGTQNLVTKLESVCQNMITSGRIPMDPMKLQHRVVKMGGQSLLLIYRPPEGIPPEPTSLKKYNFFKLDIPVEETDSMLEEGRIPDSDYIERHVNISTRNGNRSYNLIGNFGPIVKNHSLFMNGTRNQVLENGDLEAGFRTLEQLPGYLLVYGSIGARISENRFHMHVIPVPDDWAISHASREMVDRRNDVKVMKVHMAMNADYICFEGQEKAKVDMEAMNLINELKRSNCPHGVILNKTGDSTYQAYVIPVKLDNSVQSGFEALRLGIFHLAGILVFYNKDDFEKANAENLKPVFGKWVVPWNITQKYLQDSFVPTQPRFALNNNYGKLDEVNTDSAGSILKYRDKSRSADQRTKDMLGEIFGVQPIVDAEILQALLDKVTSEYRRLIERFKRESKKIESPNSYSVIYYNYLHPVSGWILEDDNMIEGVYNFALNRTSSPGVSHSLIFSIRINPETGKLSAFDPGSIVEDRTFVGNSMWSSMFVHPRPVAGRLSLKIFYPGTKAFREEAEELVREYVKSEAELLKGIQETEEFITRTDEAIKDEHHWLRTRNKLSLEDLKRNRKYFENQRAEKLAQLEQARKIIAKLKLVCSERVVLTAVVPENEPIWEGFLSHGDIGLKSPLDLLHRIDEIYPMVKKLLLEGKFPDKLGMGVLALPSPQRDDL